MYIHTIHEQCSLLGKHVFVLVVVFGVRFLNVFGFVCGCVQCLGPVLLYSVFGSGIVLGSLCWLPSSQSPVLIIMYDDHI